MSKINPLGNVEIFSIGIGVVGSGLQFSVGQEVGIGKGRKARVTDIIRDESTYDSYSEITYMIFGEVDGERKLLKAFINQPVYMGVKA